jgi:hypothetical protein
MEPLTQPTRPALASSHRGNTANDSTLNFLDSLTAAGKTIKQTGADAYLAQCPAHDDGKPSLGVRRGRGQVLVFCFAGCPVSSIVAALNLRLGDLFDNPKGIDYEYRHEGKLVRTVHRSPSKEFRQSIVEKDLVTLYDPNGGNAYKGFTVWLPEGEKDAEVIASLGHIAVSAPQGASAWAKCDYSPLFSAAEVIILADNDEAGRKRANGLYAHLTEHGVKTRIKRALVGKDVADHVVAGHGLDQLLDVIPEPPTETPKTPQETATYSKPSREPQRSLQLTPLALVESKRQQFLDGDSLIPLGAPTIFSGRGGEGKSTLALDYVARVSNGTLPGKYFGTPRNVIVIQHEDDPGTQLKPRLIAASASLDNIHLVNVRETSEDYEGIDVPSLTRDLHLVRQAIEKTAAVLVVIDPLTSSIEGDVHKLQDVRRALNPLSHLAQEYELGVICIMHVRKGHGAAADKTSGSHAFRDVARSLLIFAHDEDSGNRIVTVEKSSYSQKQGSSFAFRLESTQVPTDDGDLTDVARVVMLGESTLSVGEIWNREQDTSDNEERNEVQTWLLGFLSDRGGKALAKDIKRAATEDGFVWRTVQRAGTKLCDKIRTGFQGSVEWVLKKTPIGDIGDTGDSRDNRDMYDLNLSLMNGQPS